MASDLARRLIDVVSAAVLLVVTSPLLAASAVAIKREDGGPLIYRRRVLGLGGVEFDAFKLRTMAPDAESRLHRDPALLEEYRRNLKLKTDPRVTRVGRWLRRFSIDEIPQLFNIARGQMSLVGPRMLHPSELERFGDLGPEILAVKPGLTGLWQVSGRQDLEFADRLQLDRQYLRERSLLLDLRIILATVPAVLRGRGAH